MKLVKSYTNKNIFHVIFFRFYESQYQMDNALLFHSYFEL